MLLLRYRVPKIARHAAWGHMNDYDLETQSPWSRLIELLPVHDHAYRNCNQRPIVEYALQRSLGPNSNLAVDLSLRTNAFSPLPFNAAVETQWINGTHYVNLADTLLRENDR